MRVRVNAFLLGFVVASALWGGFAVRGMDFGSVLLSGLKSMTAALEAFEVPHQKGGLQ